MPCLIKKNPAKLKKMVPTKQKQFLNEKFFNLMFFSH